MSVDQMLILDGKRLPSIQAVIAEGRRDDFAPMAVDLAKHSGFLPAVLNGRKTGFEYYFEAAASQSPAARKFGPSQITTTTGGDMTEFLASTLFLRIVARLSKAAYYDSQGGKLVPPQQVEQELTGAIAAIQRYW